MAGRVSQVAAEGVILPSDTAVRASQLVVEVLYPRPADESANAIVSQLPVEVVVAPSDVNVRLSQMVAEAVVAPSDVNVRVSQVVVEVVIRPVRQWIGGIY